MLALSIRQPFAELILRGIKTVEYRKRPTKCVGERFYIYASKKLAAGSWQLAGREVDRLQLAVGRTESRHLLPTANRKLPTDIWSNDLTAAPPGSPAEWMIQLAEQMGMIGQGELERLPTGVIVGSAVIEGVSQVQDVEGYKF